MKPTALLLLLVLLVGVFAAAVPKNTFRPWKIGMGTQPDRPMPVPERAKFETIRGTITRPKGVQDLREGMAAPAGPRCGEVDGELREDEKVSREKKAGKLREDEKVLREKKAEKISAWKAGREGE